MSLGRIPENENLRAVKARLAEEDALVEQRRARMQIVVLRATVGGQGFALLVIGFAAFALSAVALTVASPLLWALAALLTAAFIVDAWVLSKAGARRRD